MAKMGLWGSCPWWHLVYRRVTSSQALHGDGCASPMPSSEPGWLGPQCVLTSVELQHPLSRGQWQGRREEPGALCDL